MPFSTWTRTLVIALAFRPVGPAWGGEEPVRVERTMRVRLGAAADRVFPLFGPIRESEWDPRWAPRMIFPTDRSQSEKGAVFTTDGAVWVMTVYDPARRIVGYVRVLPGVTVTEIDVAVASAGPAASEARVTCRLTPLSKAGEEPIERFRLHFPHQAAHWEEAINHLLTTGRPLVKHQP